MTCLFRFGRPVFFSFFCSLLILSQSAALYAETKPAAESEKTKPKSQLAAASSPGLKGAPPPPPSAQNAEAGVQTLLSTLNETLEENRKIRESLKTLQQSLEEKTVENSRLTGQIQKLETVSIQGSKQLTEKVEQLQSELNKSAETIQKSEAEKQAFDKGKQQILDEMEQLQKENKKIGELLKSSLLKEEKEELLKLIQHNEKAALGAVNRVAEVNAVNEKIRQELDEAYFKLGNSLFEMRNFEGAAAEYKRALQWNPANAWAHHNLGIVYDYYLNQTDLALIQYQKYIDYEAAPEKAGEIRRRILDINLLKKVTPDTPLKNDFDDFHKDKVEVTQNPNPVV